MSRTAAAGCIILAALLSICLVYSVVRYRPLPDLMGSQADHATGRIRSELSYLLEEVPEIEWMEIKGNDIYLGWRSTPEDFGMVNRGAALRANEATGFGAHVWSVRSDQRGWRPGEGSYICETTARHGKVTDSTCPGSRRK